MSDIFVLKFTYSFKILAFCHRNEAMALTTVYFSGVFSQQVQVVGGHDDGRPLGADFAQQFHNHPSGLHASARTKPSALPLSAAIAVPDRKQGRLCADASAARRTVTPRTAPTPSGTPPPDGRYLRDGQQAASVDGVS